MASGPDSDLFPKVGYLMSIGQCEAASRFHRGLAEQNANAVWSFGTRLPGHVGTRTGSRLGYCTPCLFKLRYGEPAVTRIYNDLPDDRTRMAASAAMRSRRISTTPITAPRATAPATPTTSPAPSTITIGA